jgi:hypothetical protein
MRVRAFIAAAIIAALTGPGWAQQAPVPRYGEVDKEKSFNEKEQEKEADRAYKRSLGNVPEKGPVDPWGNARSAEAPKPPATKSAAKADVKAAPPKPKTKTGESAK